VALKEYCDRRFMTPGTTYGGDRCAR